MRGKPAKSGAPILPFLARVPAALRVARAVLVSPFALDRTLQDFLSETAEGGMSDAWLNTRTTSDKPWPTRVEDLSNALAAWRTNPLARRIVNLCLDHVWGNGITPTSQIKIVRNWLEKFWNDELNAMVERIPRWITAWTMDGEVFPTFHQNPIDGSVYLRELAALQIQDIKWRPNDYEQLLLFGQRIPGRLDLAWWKSIKNPEAAPDESLMWQYAVNRVVGAVRGEGDMTPALPWLGYYSDWLEDRVERNAVLSKFYYSVTVPNATDVKDAETKYSKPPESGTYVVHAESEKHEVMQPKVGADEAKADGFALKSMIAAGGSTPNFWLGDVGEGNTEATAAHMTDVSYRFYETRQGYVRRVIKHLSTYAYFRAAAAGAVRTFRDPEITTSVADIRRADNERLAQAARDIVEAFAEMIAAGLDRDKRLVKLIWKFAGEDLDEKEIDDIVKKAEERAGAVGRPAPNGND